MIEELKAWCRSRRYALAAGAILFGALAIRLWMMLGPMEYDEIWTLRNYVGKPLLTTLTDLATPNNHPLNSLLVQFWTTCFDIVQLTRLHSLVFGMLSVVLVGVLARGLFHSRAAALFSMVFMAADAAAIHYSAVARGYSAQLFFLLLFSCGMLYAGRFRRFLPWRYLPEAAMILGAVGAVLSVPSAPVFLAAAVLSARVYRRRIPDASVLIAVGVAALLVAGYLGLNYASLRTARRDFGLEMNGWPSWVGFVWMIFQDFYPLAVVPFLLVLAATDRRRRLLLGTCTVLILASAAFTGAGPSRVYLPLCVLIALGCGRGAHALFTAALCRDNRKLAAILVVSTVFLAGFGFYQAQDVWSTPDYFGWFRAGQAMPKEYLPVYPATAGVPLFFNNRELLVEDQQARLADTAATGRVLLCFGVEPGTVNGGDFTKPNVPETVLKLPVRGTPTVLNGFPAVEYRLLPVEGVPAPGAAFVAIDFAAFRQLFAGTAHGLLGLNPFFSGLVYCPAAPADPELRERMGETGARFYVFAPEAPGAARP